MVNYFGYATFLGQILLVLGIVLYLFRNSNKTFKKYALFVSKNAVSLGFLAAAIATLGSLGFSDILGFVPCKLCWFQRITIYPLVVILGIGTILNDAKAKIYALVLSLIGLVIALYHILVQVFPAWIPCSDEVANCAYVQFATFGYITIPVMSATVLAMVILLMLFGLSKK